MAMGRPNTPSALKAAAGNPGGKRLRTDEPKPLLVKDLRPPKDLLHSPMAARFWKELVEDMKEARMLAQIDRLGLAKLCNDAASMFAAQKERDKLISDGKWSSCQSYKGGQWSPVVAMYNKLSEQFAEGAAQYGMTPSSRAKLITIATQGDWIDDVDESEDELRAKIADKANRLGVVVEFDKDRRQGQA